MKQKANRVKVSIKAWKVVDEVAGGKLGDTKTQEKRVEATVSRLKEPLNWILGPQGFTGANISVTAREIAALMGRSVEDVERALAYHDGKGPCPNTFILSQHPQGCAVCPEGKLAQTKVWRSWP